jgi:hypothetical protein
VLTLPAAISLSAGLFLVGGYIIPGAEEQAASSQKVTPNVVPVSEPRR